MRDSPGLRQLFPGLFEAAAGQLIGNPANGLWSCLLSEGKPAQGGMLSKVITARRLIRYVIVGPKSKDLIFPLRGYTI
jgi:hypothetical protein